MAQNIASPTDDVRADRNGQPHLKAGFWALTLGSLGVVYGDIGTSPLYALREAVVAAAGSGNGVTEQVVLGVVSLILWALLLVVTAKYVLILLRLDNNGEGGTLALMALAQRAMGRSAATVFLLGVSSAALFYGDAIITPAISVLSAIEGVKIVAPGFEPMSCPRRLPFCAGYSSCSRAARRESPRSSGQLCCSGSARSPRAGSRTLRTTLRFYALLTRLTASPFCSTMACLP